MLDVIGLDHLYVSVSDFERAEAFYDRVMRLLGFRKGDKPIAGEPHAHYFTAGLQYTIRPARSATAHDPYAPGLHHVCFQLRTPADVDAAYVALREAGVEATPPRRYPEYNPDYYATFFRDPDGLRLELVARTPYRDELASRWHELEEFLNPLAALHARSDGSTARAGSPREERERVSSDDVLRPGDAKPDGEPEVPRRADQDLTLLARPELRPVRLMLEYLKPELRLEDRRVRHSIVVFGSTHLRDAESARAAVGRAERDVAAHPDDPSTHEALRRARDDLTRSRYYEIGRELGRLVGEHPPSETGHRLAVVTGGGSGGMEAANRGAREAGAESVGLNIALPHEQHPNPWITPGLSFEFRYFALRKLHFMLRARALVTLPGGYGTLDELFETLCLLQTHKRAPMPVVLIGEAFWRRLVDFDFLVAQGMVAAEDLALFQFAETAQQAWDAILAWYAARNRSIFDFPPGREEVP